MFVDYHVHSEFSNDSVDDVLLILDAMKITKTIGFPFSSVGEGAVAFQMDSDAFFKITVVFGSIESNIWCNFNTADGVDEIDGGVEIDAEIVIDINV